MSAFPSMGQVNSVNRVVLSNTSRKKILEKKKKKKNNLTSISSTQCLYLQLEPGKKAEAAVI